MKSSKRKISLAVALVLSGFGVASAAMAQTAPSLLGGGSTLVQPTIGSESAAFPVADGKITYFGVGSGAGQSAFLNNDSTQFSAGLSATVNFANSDAPLSTAQISTYQAGRAKTDGALIQIPYIVTPITIPLVNGPTGTGPALPNSTTPTVALNDADLCGIFSGNFTNWNQVTNPDNGSKYPAAAITVVYRSDNSGTTDLLTAHLAKVCPAAGTSSITFVETQGFASLFPSSTPPSNFKPASGSGGVAALLDTFKSPGTVAAVGYLSPDWTNTSLAPSSASAAANQLAVASLRNASTNTDVIPTFANATAAVGTAGAPTVLTASNPAAWVPNASNPTTGYPISGTSQIIVSQCYANHGNTPSVTASVVDFLTQHYSASNATLLHNNGFDSVPSGFLTAITNDFLTSTNTLGIGNSTKCGAIAGR
ncbi:substrate-binding domain-containing protein [Paraburkholderia sp. SARCC-3016]|uniref:substrate-binding domain-containing protein n=1 Tax=Paraburkholderia sp. SARCC-3016 TaxID=3058611 RepID=UPI002808A555|nr:substrate-binding domain-containing protein [Paraburkholderia sp. SARCC-3016]MDQ7979713.1 substrate-binding domain-containing protein [Paraburkholderia sp. SARCC-3016]